MAFVCHLGSLPCSYGGEQLKLTMLVLLEITYAPRPTNALKMWMHLLDFLEKSCANPDPTRILVLASNKKGLVVIPHMQ